MSVATFAEVSFAKAFLRAAGADSGDNYLLLLTIGWMRASSGSFAGIRGNNPFLVMATRSDSRFRIGTFRLDRYGGTPFSSYANMNAAIRATIHQLRWGRLDNVRNAPFAFRSILFALQHAHGKQGAIALAQLIAQSAWNPLHYTGGAGRNLILRAMSRITGLHLTPPPPQPKPPKPPRRQPPGLPTTPQPVSAPGINWPDPYAPQKFLNARRWQPPLWQPPASLIPGQGGES